MNNTLSAEELLKHEIVNAKAKLHFEFNKSKKVNSKKKTINKILRKIKHKDENSKCKELYKNFTDWIYNYNQLTNKNASTEKQIDYVTLGVTVSDDMKEKIKQIASKKNVSMSEYLRNMIDENLK